MDQTSTRPPRRWGGFNLNQWVVLAVLGGLMLAIGATLALVLRAGWAELEAVRPVATLDPDVRVPGLHGEIPADRARYQPPMSVPLATPSTPSGLVWWDARFAYRHAVRFDSVASQSPTGTWARVILDGERAQEQGEMRADATDVRLLVWTGQRWHEIPRLVRRLPGTMGWEVVFALQEPESVPLQADDEYVYYVYYGHPFADSAPAVADAPETLPLLLELGDQEGVEWGAEVIWKAGVSTVQTLVSPDGRIVIEHQPGALREDTRVRLRTIPLSEKSGHGPLPAFELHADPPPGSPGPDNVVRWDPPLVVTINWAGLDVAPEYLETWSYFAYDTNEGLWRSVPVEYDPERGLIRMTTDQL